MAFYMIPLTFRHPGTDLKDEAWRNIGYQTYSDFFRHPQVRSIWMCEQRNRFTSERIHGLTAHVVDDFGNLAPVRYTPISLRE